MNIFKAVWSIGAALTLTACVAHREPPDVRGVSFPVRADSYRSDGIVAAPQKLQLVRPGLDKDQVRQLLGAPHFSEGLFFVHDWNYLIKLPQGDGWLECQLQIQFDAQSRVRASYWKRSACDAIAPLAVAQARARESGAADSASSATAQAENDAPPLTEPAAVKTVNWTLNDLRFPFGRSAITDLRRVDRDRLYAFAAQFGDRAAQVQRIQIAGHADRLGSASRKYERSLARARAVAKVFAASGIDPERIEVVGRSDREAVTVCRGAGRRGALRACLAPDRGVDVSVLVVPDGGRKAARR